MLEIPARESEYETGGRKRRGVSRISHGSFPSLGGLRSATSRECNASLPLAKLFLHVSGFGICRVWWQDRAEASFFVLCEVEACDFV
jgi:hypothetical protein